MRWVQMECRQEVHGDGSGGDLLLRDAREDFSPWAGEAACVYLDPPFMTGEDFSLRMRIGQEGWETGRDALVLPAYSDRFASRQQYLDFLRKALENARALLREAERCGVPAFQREIETPSGSFSPLALSAFQGVVAEPAGLRLYACKPPQEEEITPHCGMLNGPQCIISGQNKGVVPEPTRSIILSMTCVSASRSGDSGL